MISLGVLMMMDILHERGFAEADHRFGDPKRCHFPLFTWLKPLAFQWMCLLYLFMWLGKDLFALNLVGQCSKHVP